MLRHSLFYDTQADAERAEAVVDDRIYNVIEDSFLMLDDACVFIGVRFFTQERLSDMDQRLLLGNIPPVASYTFNVDDSL